MEAKILRLKCPNCAESFLPTEAIWSELKDSIQSELHDELAAQQVELQKEKERVQKLVFKLSADKQQLEAIVLSKVKTKESELRKKIEEQINSEKQEELQLMESELLKKTKQLSELNKTKREMLILQQEMEDKETEIQLRYQKKLTDQLEEARLTARAQANEENTLALAQKEKLISDLKNQIQSAKYTADSYSGQLVGETQELLVEKIIQENFASDRVVPIPKGISGADCIVEVMVSGTCISKLLIESKSVKSFSKGWLKRLHENNLSIGAQALILVVKQMPKELEGERFAIMENVFITTPASLKSLVLLLRYSVLKIADVTRAHEGRQGKESLIFEFLTSTSFENLAQNVLAQLDALKLNFEQERKKVTKLWAERQKMLELATMSTVEFFGKLHGITSEIPKIDSLEISLDNAA